MTMARDENGTDSSRRQARRGARSRAGRDDGTNNPGRQAGREAERRAGRDDAGNELPLTCELAYLPTCQLATILYVVLYLLCLFMD